jgi:hypothetical protein
MPIIEHHPLVEEILQSHQSICKGDESGYRGYRGHVYRMLNYCLALSPQGEEGTAKFAIAAAFHDLQVFESFDYLGPSVKSAERFLHASGRQEWLPEIAAMIVLHHKLTGYAGEFAKMVEPFRQADWIEMSFGVMRFGLSKDFVREVRRSFSVAAFYPRSVLRSAVRWWLRHPLTPTPYYPTRRKIAAIVSSQSTTSQF